MTKTAARRMYIAGFCKTARACGIDPVALVKLAAKVYPSQIVSFYKKITGTNPFERYRTVDPILEAASRFTRGAMGRAARRAIAEGTANPPAFGVPVLKPKPLSKAFERGLSGLTRTHELRQQVAGFQRLIAESGEFPVGTTVFDVLKAHPMASQAPIFRHAG